MKALTFFILNLIPCFVLAQEGWTTKDSIKLSKMLDGEISVHINDAFKKELEQSLTGFSIENKSNKLIDFILGVKPENNLMEYPHFSKSNLYIQCHLLSDSSYCKKNEYMRFNGIRISSKVYTDNPFISIKRNTNISIPLGKKLNFNIYGDYTFQQKRSVILPVTSIPYEFGIGFSYRIGKHTVIKSQTNYQYNLIWKKWEWFFGAGITFNF